MPFTRPGAWHFIEDRLAGGCPLEKVTLSKPPGVTAYVMQITLEQDMPPLYVKLEITHGEVLGRSFHYSTVEREKDER
jgi:hypothetical protein